MFVLQPNSRVCCECQCGVVSSAGRFITMKPLFPIVVAILVIATNAHSKSTESKVLAESKEPVAEAEESEPQTRSERCTVCSGTSSLKTHSHHASGNFQTLPQISEVHTQQFFEECNSEKGCAGVKLKDGKLVQKYGDLDAFKAAAEANNGDEFQFQAAASKVLEGKIPNSGPFWWMNENSPFKNVGGAGGNSQKFSKFQSSSFSTASNGGSGGVNIAANPFLNGELSKINNGFTSGGANFAGQGFKASGGSQGAGFSTSGTGLANGFGSGSQSSYGSSSQNSFAGGQNGFSAQGGLNQAGFGGGLGGSQSNFNAFNSASKFGSGFTGSSPAPFSSTGANVNLIQNSQKTSDYDFEQQQQTQQNIDEAFAATGNVQGSVNSGGELQQTCTGQGYICVHKTQCNNGVVNTNGGNLQRENTQKQYCNTRTEACCRWETSSSAGTGIPQGTFGVGTSTFSGSTNQQSGVFSQGGSRPNSFGSSSNNDFNSLNRGTTSSGFGINTNQFSGTGISGTSQVGSSYGGNKFTGSAVGSGFGTTVAPTPTRFGGNNYNNEVFKTNSQSNFVETDSFPAGSQNSGVYRPNGIPNLKPGVPYLPPVDSSTGASNIYPSTIVTSPRPFTTPRPVTTLRPFTQRVTPTYLPPVSSTSAPGYLPPVDPLDGSESRPYVEGGVIRDTFLPPTPGPVKINNEIPAGCAAALKCTPIEFCTAEGVISNTTVFLTQDQDAYRVPLTDCKNIETGRIGKCCRDPYYTDPWPVNQLGKWVPDVFGGNDGKYIPDSRGSPNNPRPFVTARPPTQPGIGSVILNNFRTTQEPGLNQVTSGYPSITPGTVNTQGSYGQGGKGQYGQRGQGQYGQGSSVSQTTSGIGQVGVGQIGQTVTQSQGAYGQAGKGQLEVVGQGIQRNQGSGFTVNQGIGQGVRQGVGQTVTQTSGTGVTQGFGTGFKQGQGTILTENQGFGVQQGTGQTISQGGGISVTQGFGTGIRQGQGQYVSQGVGQGVREGSGFTVTQGQNGFGVAQNTGFGVTQGQGQGFAFNQGQGILQGQGQALKQGQGEEITQESVHRVFLSRYDGTGQCGVLNPQKPYGNRQDLEVDFAEIPWQAMVLLQTNRSLLCGGVITRPDVVLTSASCVEGLLAKNVLIKGGEWKLGVDDEPLPFQIVQVKHILRHPLYEPGHLKYDAAVLVLSENLRLQKNIWPICLPSTSDRLDAYYNGNGECIVTGWGKNILQAHFQGSIMHGLNVSLINPQECETKLQEDYPHLLDNYDQDSCVCGQPTNPTNNICKVDTGSALACTTDGQYTLRGIYSWESGCQVGNQLAAFYKFDVEWYEWSIGLIESVRFAQFTTTQITKTKIITQVKGGIKGGTISGIKGFGVKGQAGSTQFGLDNPIGIKTGQFSQFNKFTSGGKISSELGENAGLNFGTELKAPLSKTFSATFTEKKIFQTEPKFVTYTTKPEIVTFTTKPEYFTYTTKPKIVTYTTKPEIVTYTTKPEIVTYTTKPEYFTYTTKPKIVSYTTKPQIISYETSGSATNPKYVSPFSFSEIVGAKHTHSPQCNCNGKK
ncbi:unnamed protein product [Arctia plantaginis]|uniref:Peptidase S1 domain-containing protein n=1 Tax=Arctia plantaginis TaxID=874455 RepID=A0A8S1BEE5_ARCPL|nr:unnamed protein product [Arctia plantaginis]